MSNVLIQALANIGAGGLPIARPSITCPRCNSCYVGQTRRHLITRIKEHGRKNAPVSIHMRSCQHTLTIDDVTILKACSHSTRHLMTLEALFINQLKPQLNTKDEYRSRTLVVKFYLFILYIFFFSLLFVLFYSLLRVYFYIGSFLM